VWERPPLSGGDRVVVFLNATDEVMEMTASLEDVFVSDEAGRVRAVSSGGVACV